MFGKFDFPWINSTEYILEAVFILSVAVDLDRVSTLVSNGTMTFAAITEAVMPFPLDFDTLQAVLTILRALDDETNI